MFPTEARTVVAQIMDSSFARRSLVKDFLSKTNRTILMTNNIIYTPHIQSPKLTSTNARSGFRPERLLF
jgi:hypothetical protein